MKPVSFIISIVVGIFLGLVGSRYVFVRSWLSLIPWGIAGLLIGFFSGVKKAGLINGVAYGFALCFFFMVFGYSGTFSLVSRFPFFAVIGLIGAVFGLVLALIGITVKKKMI